MNRKAVGALSNADIAHGEMTLLFRSRIFLHISGMPYQVTSLGLANYLQVVM